MSSAPLRLAMLGMIPGNGHPYSWSAIVNGYDPLAMQRCPYPGIIDYLHRQPLDSIGIAGARVTHLWTDDPAEAPLVAAASKIAHVVSQPEAVIGEVDAVVISTDDGDDHVRRARPFVEAGLPVFVDKPLATNLRDLRQFEIWIKEGRNILSSSGIRYSPEIVAARASILKLGDLRWISSVTAKSWERYAIHALEAVYPLLGPGLVDVTVISQETNLVATLTHITGVPITIAVLGDAYGSFGTVHLYGTKGEQSVRLTDTYAAFRGQLVAVVDYFRTGISPIPFAETREMMLAIIAGRRSLSAGGVRIALADLARELETL